jgi:hypothetical protein
MKAAYQKCEKALKQFYDNHPKLSVFGLTVLCITGLIIPAMLGLFFTIVGLSLLSSEEPTALPNGKQQQIPKQRLHRYRKKKNPVQATLVYENEGSTYFTNGKKRTMQGLLEIMGRKDCELITDETQIAVIQASEDTTKMTFAEFIDFIKGEEPKDLTVRLQVANANNRRSNLLRSSGSFFFKTYNNSDDARLIQQDAEQVIDTTPLEPLNDLRLDQLCEASAQISDEDLLAALTRRSL